MASLVLLGLIIASIALPAGIPNWLRHIATGLAILVGLAFLLNVSLMFRDWRKDHLFIIRNITFYAGLITALILIWILARSSVEIGSFNDLWWLAPLLLFDYTRRLSYVRLDAVRFDVKLGLGKSEHIALFQLAQIEIGLTSVEAMLKDGRSFTLLKSYFSKNRWRILTNKLEQLRQKANQDLNG